MPENPNEGMLVHKDYKRDRNDHRQSDFSEKCGTCLLLMTIVVVQKEPKRELKTRVEPRPLWQELPSVAGFCYGVQSVSCMEKHGNI